jgi:hypothetical protein
MLWAEAQKIVDQAKRAAADPIRPMDRLRPLRLLTATVRNAFAKTSSSRSLEAFVFLQAGQTEHTND